MLGLVVAHLTKIPALPVKRWYFNQKIFGMVVRLGEIAESFCIERTVHSMSA